MCLCLACPRAARVACAPVCATKRSDGPLRSSSLCRSNLRARASSFATNSAGALAHFDAARCGVHNGAGPFGSSLCDRSPWRYEKQYPTPVMASFRFRGAHLRCRHLRNGLNHARDDRANQWRTGERIDLERRMHPRCKKGLPQLPVAMKQLRPRCFCPPPCSRVRANDARNAPSCTRRRARARWKRTLGIERISSGRDTMGTPTPCRTRPRRARQAALKADRGADTRRCEQELPPSARRGRVLREPNIPSSPRGRERDSS